MELVITTYSMFVILHTPHIKTQVMVCWSSINDVDLFSVGFDTHDYKHTTTTTKRKLVGSENKL